MSVQLAIITFYMFFSIVMLISSTAFLIQKRRYGISGFFVLLAVCILFYLFGYVMELNSNSLEKALFWHRFQYIGFPFVSVIWLFFTFQYMNKFVLLNKWSKLALLLLPVGTFVLRHTNRYHGLLYSGFSFIQKGPFFILVLERGPLYFIQIIYNSLYFVLIYILLLLGWIQGDKDQKRSLFFIGLLSFFPIMGLFLNYYFSPKTGLDYTALLIPISIFLFVLPINKILSTGNSSSEPVTQLLEMIRRVAYRKALQRALIFSLQTGCDHAEPTFFQDAVQYLSQETDMDYVALHRIDDPYTCVPLACIYKGKITNKTNVPGFRRVLERQRSSDTFLYYRRNVQKIFPYSSLLKEIKAQCMIQIPLFNADETPIAIVTYIGRSPTASSKMVHMITKIIGNRIVSEIARIKADQIIQESEEKYRLLVTKMNQGLAVFKEIKENQYYRLEVMDVNPGFEKLINLSKNQIVGKDFFEIFPDIKPLLMDAFEKKSLRLEVYYKACDKYIDVLFYSPKAGQIAAICSDITDRKKREAEIIYTSNHDLVTGLYNRNYFEKIKSELKKPENLPLSLIVGDIDGLKLTNDIFGHDEGDRLLIESSRILLSHSKPQDIVARIGGDEFIIVLFNTGYEEAKEICNRIYGDFSQADKDKEKVVIRPNISLGCSTINSMDESIGTAYRNAEADMYRQKFSNKKKNLAKLMSNIKSIMFERTLETQEHIDRLLGLGRRLGKALNLFEEDLQDLELVCMFHDIGKMKIDKNILSKTEPLTDLELAELRKYPETGYRIALATPELFPVADYILCIHEYWDGTGYPRCLSGQNIPFLSRVFAVINAYDAMTHDRPYRKALTHEEALEQIRLQKGTRYDPCIVDAFLGMFQTTAIE
jgi:diguanylate cyclase (GGDEF)-like protein